MGFHSLLYVYKINLEYLCLPFVLRILYKFFMFCFCFLSTSETNQYLRNKPDEMKQRCLCFVCMLCVCVTGKKSGCALPGAQTIKHAVTCCKSC